MKKKLGSEALLGSKGKWQISKKEILVQDYCTSEEWDALSVLITSSIYPHYSASVYEGKITYICQ